MATQDQKDLNKSLNLAIFGIVGCIIPVIGLLVSIIALVLSTGVPENNSTSRKKRTILIVATIGIVLSLLSGIGYYALYQSRVQAARQLTEFEQSQKVAACQQEVDDTKNQILALNAKYADKSDIFSYGYNTATKNCTEGIELATNHAKQLYANALSDAKERCDAYYQKTFSDGFKQESLSLGRTDGRLPKEYADRWEERLSQWKKDCMAEFAP